MLYGMYLSAQGANAQSTRLDVIANNLANASTTGFKKSLAVFQQLDNYDENHGESLRFDNPVKDSTGGVGLADVVTSFAQGPLEETRAALDIALAGPGFLQVADSQGKQFLTRNGKLTTNADGELVMAGTGHHVLSADGDTITLPANASRIQISADGIVNGVNSDGAIQAGRIGIVMPQSLAGLQARGNSLYESKTPVNAATEGTEIAQGYLEGSGVNAVNAMKDMIETSRAFEMNANLIKHQDESLARLLQALPRR